MHIALGSIDGRPKRKRLYIVIVVSNFVLYYKCCGILYALLVFFTHEFIHL